MDFHKLIFLICHLVENGILTNIWISVAAIIDSDLLIFSFWIKCSLSDETMKDQACRCYQSSLVLVQWNWNDEKHIYICINLFD